VSGPHTASRRVRSLSAVLPAFNEAGNIERVLEDLLSALSRVTDDLEVIVVDDGSTDRTHALADAVRRRDGRVQIARHPRNLGYGAALRTGFRRATKEYVFYTDADGQFDPREISKLLALLPTADVVSGFRQHRQDPLHRRLNARLYNGLLRHVIGLPLHDVNCAFKLYRAQDLAGLTIRARGALVDAEILAQLHQAGRTIAQVGIAHFPRRWGRPSGNRLGVLARAAWETAVLWPTLSGRRTPGGRSR
jgi:glycosyltransferase involved in cell wall biosynthesis